MRVATRLLFGLLLAAIFFTAGGYIAAKRGWFHPGVTVKVINESGQRITSMRVQYWSGGGKGIIEDASLQSTNAKLFQFLLGGEGSYTLEATLEDGRVLKGGEGYVENGYLCKQVISKTGIRTYPIRGLYDFPL